MIHGLLGGGLGVVVVLFTIVHRRCESSSEEREGNEGELHLVSEAGLAGVVWKSEWKAMKWKDK